MVESNRKTKLSQISWIFCPGHAGIKGNEEADKLAGKAKPSDNIKLDKCEALDLLARTMKELEQTEWNTNYSIQRMKYIGVQKGQGKTSKLSGCERRRMNQRCIGTVSIYTLRAILRRGTEQPWAWPDCNEVVPGDK